MNTTFESRETGLLARRRPSFGKILLWGLIGLALLYAAWMAFDLFTHPFEAGANRAIGSPNLFRWLSFFSGFLTLGIALVILRKVPGNLVGPLLLLWGVGAMGWSARTEYASLVLASRAILIFNLYFFCLALPAVVLLLYYFPTGKAHPQWLNRWIILFSILMGFFGLLYIAGTPPAEQSGMPNLIYRPGFEFGVAIDNAAFLLFTVGAVVSLTLRYRRGSSRERLQLRWFLWLLALVILITLISSNPFGWTLRSQGVLLLKVVVFILWQCFPAVAIGVALLRHRLWDIDVIIRKTLVYSVVTGLLALVYFGGVVLLQEAFIGLGAGQSPAAIVLSTLVIAALFNPLRKRVQDAVDRRFYRKKYDAEQALAGFAARARDEVDVERLSTELVRAVDETVQPERASLWLKKGGRGE